jgi:hypothetical protein
LKSFLHQEQALPTNGDGKMPQFYLATDQDGMRHLLTVATEASKMDPNMVSLEIGSDKTSIQNALQELLTEADKAKKAASLAEIPEETEEFFEKAELKQPAPISTESYAGWSLKLEEVWDNLPLAHKLHFGARAMEAAREKLG